MNTTKRHSNYEPVPGSIPDRVIRSLRQHPDDRLSAADIADMFDVDARHVAGALVTAVTEHVLVRETDHEGTPVWRLRVRPPHQWPGLGTSEPRRRKKAFKFDPSMVELRDDLPIYERPTAVKQLLPILGEMKVKQSFVLPLEARGVLTTVKLAYCKVNPEKEFAIRQINKQQVGIWRTA